MITKFEIFKFKKFKHFVLDNLSQVNIILGNNNTGKTTILEAVFAFACGENINAMLPNSILRNKLLTSYYDFMEQILSSLYDQDEKPFRFCFKARLNDGSEHQFEHLIDPNTIFAELKPKLMGSFGGQAAQVSPRHLISLGGQVEIVQHGPQVLLGNWRVIKNGKESHKAQITWPNPDPSSQREPFMLARFADILAHRDQAENVRIYSYLKRENAVKEFVDQISNSFVQVSDIDVIPYPNGSFSPVNIKTPQRGLLPIYSYGDGVQRWYNLLGGMVLFRNAIHCIEEVDVTFHPNAQSELALNLVKYAQKYNNQLFMTTHNLEFMDNFLNALYSRDDRDGEDMVRVITLRNDNETGQTMVRILSGRQAFESREKYQLELR